MVGPVEATAARLERVFEALDRAIPLRMLGSGRNVLDAQDFEEIPPDCAAELQASVRGECRWDAKAGIPAVWKVCQARESKLKTLQHKCG